MAAKNGGSYPGGNPRLRLAIADAKAANMPAENIERAVKKGTGELEGVNYEDVTYEGYGPGGAAILVQCTTDNPTRTVADLRNIFLKGGGNLGTVGSIAWDSAEYAMIPKNTVKVEGPAATQLVKLMETIEEHDDVSKVFSNFDVDEEALAGV